MAIGRTFEEAIQKAIRMVSQHWDGFLSGYAKASKEELRPSSYRIAAIAQALYEGNSNHYASSLRITEYIRLHCGGYLSNNKDRPMVPQQAAKYHEL